jgi:hypothetical protein
MRPLLKNLEIAASPEEQTEAEKPLLALGSRALPNIRERLVILKPDQPGYAHIKELAAKMACIVDDIQFSKESATPTKDFRKQVDALRGKPLNHGQVAELLRTFASALPAGVTGIKMSIDREGDDTGVSLAVTLTTKKVAQQGTQKGWDTFERISVNGRNTHNSFGFCSWDYGLSQEYWQEFATQLRKALEAPPEQSFSVRVGIIQGE